MVNCLKVKIVGRKEQPWEVQSTLIPGECQKPLTCSDPDSL